MKTRLNAESLDKALYLLAGRLEIEDSFPLNLIVCGGSSLVATG